jgi:hypothetical protein
MKHPHAAILQAIAEDKDTEIEQRVYQTGYLGWMPASLEFMVVHPSATYRIKPKLFLINGVECPIPVEANIKVTQHIEIFTGGGGASSCARRMYWFATDADLMAVFNAVIKPFESEGK